MTVRNLPRTSMAVSRLWAGMEKKGLIFFRLIGLIAGLSGWYTQRIEKFLKASTLENVFKLLEKEFNLLMSSQRRELIRRCLILRQQRLQKACEN
jgi:hypothetical protein